MTFDLYPLRFGFTARDSIYFPSGKSGNILRGAFGLLFRKIACLPSCTDARTCERRGECSYARIFSPSAAIPGPSGLADWPRPFVFRAAHLDGETLAPGAPFHFDVHLFDIRESTAAGFALAFAQLVSEGIGPRRGKAELTSLRQIGEEDDRPLLQPATFGLCPLGPPLRLELTPAARGILRVRVQFQTPTELKAGSEVAARPEFAVLFARIRDRIGTLRALYGAGPLDIDFKGIAERAARVHMTRCELSTVDVQRRSSRTGQVHSLGGFVGIVEYEGALDEFLPYLHAARWTGAGRQTVWGKGEISVEEL